MRQLGALKVSAPTSSWRSESVTLPFVRSKSMLASQIDPWVQTIRLLSCVSQRTDANNEMPLSARRCAPFGQDAGFSTGPSLHLVVNLIERTSSSTVTIAWRDATSCFYGAQIWRVTNAKVSGVCAMSGARIKRGDRIFLPRHSKPAPVNAKAMILASVIECVDPVGARSCPFDSTGETVTLL